MSFSAMTHSSNDQQCHSTVFALEAARSSYQPAICIDSAFLVDASLNMPPEGAKSLFHL